MAFRVCFKLRGATRLWGAQQTRRIETSDEAAGLKVFHENAFAKKVHAIQRASYGGKHRATILPGSGIGPEIMGYVQKIFQAAGVPVDFEEVLIDPNSEDNDDLDYAILTIKRNGVALKANIETNSLSTAISSRNVAIRNELDLFVCVNHCQSIPGLKSRFGPIDLVIIRQNTEGEYSMLEHEAVPGVVEMMKVITRSNSERCARFAFEYAVKNNRKTVTTIHKANIMKLADGLFLQTARRIAKDYPKIKHNDMIIDNCCMQLVSNPYQFDVMLTPNLYGTIVAHVVSGMMGGAGVLSGRNYGEYFAVFEPGVRGTAARLAGTNKANPLAMIKASIDMLDYLNVPKHARRLERAITKTVFDKLTTPDLGGKATSTEFVDAIIANLDDSLD